MNHSFNMEFAINYGLEESIMIQSFQFWIIKNKANGSGFRDGRFWTYNSAKAMIDLFPYWSEKQIRRIVDSLISQGVLIKGSYNKNPHDRTTWYAFKDESIFLNGQMDLPKRANGTSQKGKCITDTIPVVDNNTDNAVQPVVANQKRAEISIEKRKQIFLDSLKPFEEKFGVSMVKEFYDYWTELSTSGKKLRFEGQAFFDLSRRLATWKKNQKPAFLDTPLFGNAPIVGQTHNPRNKPAPAQNERRTRN